MAKFRNVKQAVKNGYKIFEMSYNLENQEWYIFMKGYDKDLCMDNYCYFYLKQLPKYLKPEMVNKHMIKVINYKEIAVIKTNVKLLFK